jgi:chemotaxis protein CheX
VKNINHTAVCEGLQEAVRGILLETASLKVEAHAIEKEEQPAHMSQGVTVIVGVTGDIEGSFTISIPEDFAVRYTAALLEVEVVDYDEVVASAIGEFGNMVVAQTSMYLIDHDITCDLCPPTILRTEGGEIRGPQSNLFTVRFASDWGEIFTRVFIKRTVPPRPPKA